METTTKQRIRALLLTLYMLLALAPVTALAANEQPRARSTPSVGFADIKSAIAGAKDGTAALPTDDGAPFAKPGDATAYFGYAWNSVENRWDIEAWNEGGTRHIKLNANADGSGKENILISNQTVTLDLNGHTIAGAGTYVLGINVGTTVTVRDTSAGAKGSITGGVGTTTVVNDYGTFHLESGTVHAEAQRGISISSKGTATIAEGAVVESDDASSKGRAVVLGKDCSLTTSGEIRSKYTGIYANGTGSNVEIAGGTIDADYEGVFSNGRIAMTGGTVNGDEHGIYTYNKTAALSVSGGKITGGNSGVTIYRGGVHTVTGGEIEATEQYGNGITIWGYQTPDNAGNFTVLPYGETKLTVSGGKITGRNFGISGNGKVIDTGDNPYSCGGTVINITGNAEIHGDSGTGIYHPQNGVLNIDGGSITGASGVEMRAGNLNMTGGTVMGESSFLESGMNHSGSTVTGAGIVISQHDTRQTIDARISGGTIEGYTSFYEDSFQDNTPEDLTKVSLRITGGRFVSTGASSAFSRNKDVFITAGTYSRPVGRYAPAAGKVMDHLGCLTPEEMKEACIQSTLESPTGKVNCIRVENSELPYHVGYLSGTGSSLEMRVGEESDPLVPLYSLNGDPVGFNVVCAAFVDAGDVNHIAKSEELPVIAKWSSGDDTVATVDDNGVVTAVSVSASPVTITATLLNGETVPFSVTVIPTVTFNMNGHGTQVAAQTVRHGGTAAKPADPSAEGWTFDGWYTDAALTAAFDFSTPITENTSVHAKWTVNDYSVSFIMNGHGTQVVPQTVEHGGTAIKPDDPSSDGWTFDGWYTDATLTTAFDFNFLITADTMVYAKWEKNTVTPVNPTNPSRPKPSTKPAENTPNPKADLPQTGDDTNVFLWIALLVVSCGGLAGILASKRQYK